MDLRTLSLKKRENDVGGENNAWMIVINQGLEKTDPWVDEAIKKVNKIKDRVKTKTRAWVIVRAQSLNNVDGWVDQAEKKVYQIKNRVNGETNAWMIVVGQGLGKTDKWVDEAEKKVMEIKGRVGNEGNAWRIVISHGLEKIDEWLVKAEKEVSKGTSWNKIIKYSLEESQNEKDANNEDSAMLNQKLDVKGGIDLNANTLPLDVQGSGIDFNFSMPAELCIDDDNDGSCNRINIEALENMPITGFTPVIFQIVPITNLGPLLGIAEEKGPFNSAESEDEQQDLSFINQYRNKYFVCLEQFQVEES